VRKTFQCPQTIRRGIKDLIEEANAEIETLSAADSIKAASSDDVVIVDIRDPPRDRSRDGRIPGAFLVHPRHARILDRSGQPLRQADLPAGQRKVHLPLAPAAWRSALRRQDRQGHGPENRLPTWPVVLPAWRDAGGPGSRSGKSKKKG